VQDGESAGSEPALHELLSVEALDAQIREAAFRGPHRHEKGVLAFDLDAEEVAVRPGGRGLHQKSPLARPDLQLDGRAPAEERPEVDGPGVLGLARQEDPRRRPRAGRLGVARDARR